MEKIKVVLSRCFECDFNVNPNSNYDSLFSAQDVIDAIVEIAKESKNA